MFQIATTVLRLAILTQTAVDLRSAVIPVILL